MQIFNGCDVLRLERIEQSYARYGEAFMRKILTPQEEAEWLLLPEAKRVGRLAAVFALKEAISKALGTGLWHQGLGFMDINLTFPKGQAPRANFSRRALQLERLQGRCSWSVSLSHEADLYLASAVLLREAFLLEELPE